MQPNERWERIEKLYQAALERPPGERAAFLEEACAGDEGLRRELESLLAHGERAASFLAAPVVDWPVGTFGEDSVPALGDEDSSMVGKTIAHYKVLEKLGKGGMGEVWKAHDQKLGREVAIKTLPEEFARDEERLARFKREARLLASLNHPNVAAIYGLEEDNGTRFLVLELVEGETLAERLKSGPIPVEESLELALQIAEALEAAHEKGVIHRDLKPANIKVTPDSRVKVLDYWSGEDTRDEQLRSDFEQCLGWDPSRRCPGHPGLHEPRAGTGSVCRCADRRLGSGLRSLRNAKRGEGVRWKDDGECPQSGRESPSGLGSTSAQRRLEGSGVAGPMS